MVGPPSTAADLASAFLWVFGSPPPFVETLDLPGGTETLAVTPAALTPVGRGRYALTVREVNGMLPHAAVGAVSVAYVERAPVAYHPDHWRSVGRWPQIALNGDSGGQALKAEIRRDLGKRPLLLVTGDEIATGDQTNDAIIIRLDAEKPVPIGRVSLGASNADAFVGNSHARYRYRGRLVPAKGRGDFAVRYEGWRTMPGSDTHLSVRGTVTYALKDGCLAATAPLPAPQIAVSYSAPTDCAPARIAPTP